MEPTRDATAVTCSQVTRHHGIGRLEIRQSR
jgi:hypothetical protein